MYATPSPGKDTLDGSVHVMNWITFQKRLVTAVLLLSATRVILGIVIKRISTLINFIDFFSGKNNLYDFRWVAVIA